jgi:ketosteroid isomerase-like protein
MSEENVEAFRRAVEGANRRDVEALLAELDPDVEWHAALTGLGGDSVWRGHDGVREFLPEVWDVLDTGFELPEIRGVDDRVVALGRFRGRGKGSGVPAETPFGYVVDFRGGKAIRIQSYLDPNEALEAAGLRE